MAGGSPHSVLLTTAPHLGAWPLSLHTFDTVSAPSGPGSCEPSLLVQGAWCDSLHPPPPGGLVLREEPGASCGGPVTHLWFASESASLESWVSP